MAYWIGVLIAAVVCTVLCVEARRRPGPWTRWAGRALAVILAADAIVFITAPLVKDDWTVASSIPIALCDVALVLAAIACAWPRLQLLVELTYFWGLAGTLQAVATPDLNTQFPHLEFFEFVVGHTGIIIAAMFLVVGLRIRPRQHSVPRIWAITAAYTALVGLFDWATDSNYMFLAEIPRHASLLSVLGPWPWYVVSAAGLALVLLVVLDAPFRIGRSR